MCLPYENVSTKQNKYLVELFLELANFIYVYTDIVYMITYFYLAIVLRCLHSSCNF